MDGKMTLEQLVHEYRPTMDAEVLHSWAADVVAAAQSHLTQPAQAVDVLLGRALDAAAFLNALGRHDRAQPLREAVHAIRPELATSMEATRALGNAQAEGCEHDWSIGYGVPRSSGFIPYCRKCGDPMPSTTQATPNAHE